MLELRSPNQFYMSIFYCVTVYNAGVGITSMSHNLHILYIIKLKKTAKKQQQQAVSITTVLFLYIRTLGANEPDCRGEEGHL